MPLIKLGPQQKSSPPEIHRGFKRDFPPVAMYNDILYGGGKVLNKTHGLGV